VTEDRSLVDPDHRYPATDLTEVERRARQVLDALEGATFERTRDVFQIEYRGERGIVAVVTREALELRLPTIEWTGGSHGPVPAWQAEPHARIQELAIEFTRHLYLPRLTNWTVLAKAIAESLMIPGWEYFGYALHCGSSGYAGLYFRGAGHGSTSGLVRIRIGFLVRPEVAAKALGA
jgi:hypothetical protein